MGLGLEAAALTASCSGARSCHPDRSWREGPRRAWWRTRRGTRCQTRHRSARAAQLWARGRIIRRATGALLPSAARADGTGCERTRRRGLLARVVCHCGGDGGNLTFGSGEPQHELQRHDSARGLLGESRTCGRGGKQGLSQIYRRAPLLPTPAPIACSPRFDTRGHFLPPVRSPRARDMARDCPPSTFHGRRRAVALTTAATRYRRCSHHYRYRRSKTIGTRA